MMPVLVAGIHETSLSGVRGGAYAFVMSSQREAACREGFHPAVHGGANSTKCDVVSHIGEKPTPWELGAGPVRSNRRKPIQSRGFLVICEFGLLYKSHVNFFLPNEGGEFRELWVDPIRVPLKDPQGSGSASLFRFMPTSWGRLVRYGGGPCVHVEASLAGPRSCRECGFHRTLSQPRAFLVVRRQAPRTVGPSDTSADGFHTFGALRFR